MTDNPLSLIGLVHNIQYLNKHGKSRKYHTETMLTLFVNILWQVLKGMRMFQSVEFVNIIVRKLKVGDLKENSEQFVKYSLCEGLFCLLIKFPFMANTTANVPTKQPLR